MDSVEALRAVILELCEEKQITINKLASSAGLTQSTLDSFVRGKSGNPRMQTVEKIAQGFDISLNDLYSRIIKKMSDERGQ